MKDSSKTILIDGREFAPAARTGIGRVLEGLTNALADAGVGKRLLLAVFSEDAVPTSLRAAGALEVITLLRGFLRSEKALSAWTCRGVDLFISPYPKLPLFGCHCRAAHIIHDVLDLTHPAYRKRLRVFFDTWRLRRALRGADLSWYDSQWSLEETQSYAGLVGRNPRVRHPGIDERFVPEEQPMDREVRESYGLPPGYVLALGNGLPHKNLGLLLEISGGISRPIALAGVPAANRVYWNARYPAAKVHWIEHVPEDELPSLIRGAFCLVQPSTAEGYGYPPLEAMACGTPAIISDIPVLRETTGDNAFIADPSDPEGLHRALLALEDSSMRQTMVQKGLAWVKPLRGRHGWDSHLRDVTELLSAGSTG